MSKTNTISLLAAMTLLVVTLGYIEHWQTDQKLRIKVSARAADLEQRFSQLSVLPALLASDPRVKDVLDTQSVGRTSKVNDLLKLTSDESEVAVAFLMDANGLTVASSNYGEQMSFIGRNYGFRPYFTNAMDGESSTFFAVGATTGVPGYFVSAPVTDSEKVRGVIVVKLEPKELPLSWLEEDTTTVVSDDLGVTILSTESEFLYKPTRRLTEEELTRITTERRYEMSDESTLLASGDTRRWRFLGAQKSVSFRAESAKLSTETWTLTVLTPLRGILNRAIRNIALVFGLTALAGLLLYSYRQQKLIAKERSRTAKRLEQLVEERTQELKQAHKALVAESSFSMLGKMSAAINHEINQPLASMRFDLATLRQLLENNKSAPVAVKSATAIDELPEYSAASIVVDLDRTAKRISRVIETLRLLPKQQKSDFQPVNVYTLLQQCVETVQDDRKILSAYLRVDLSCIEVDQKFVDGHSVLLHQAVLNLLYNALDALLGIEHERYADIMVTYDKEQIQIHVRDNGEGIDPLVATVLFEPFESSVSKSEGLGLGLTLARQIVTLHGGSIFCDRVFCEDATAGSNQLLTDFTITLPLLLRDES